MSAWQLLGVILASAVFWMQYVQLKDARQPEPRKHLLMAFGLGILAWGLTILSSVVLDALGVPDIKFGDGPSNAVYCFFCVGPLEEGTKILVAYLIVFVGARLMNLLMALCTRRPFRSGSPALRIFTTCPTSAGQTNWRARRRSRLRMCYSAPSGDSAPAMPAFASHAVLVAHFGALAASRSACSRTGCMIS